MPDISYRLAEQKDLVGIHHLIRSAFDGLLKEHGFWEISPFASSRLPPVPPTGPFPWFELGLKEDHDGFWIAETESGELAGFGLSWVRGSLWYLAHLFVSPQFQGKDIGRNLMDRVMKHGKQAGITNRALATLAYNPVSISLYSRYEMYPREPLYYMECPKQNIPTESTNTELKAEKVRDFEHVRKIFTMIDEQCIGYPREKNHEFLNSQASFKSYIFTSHNEPVGYAYVAQNGRIGPVASISDEYLIPMVRTSLGYAASENTPNVSLTATGSNNALMRLAIQHGMKIRDNFLLMSTKPFQNISNYVLYPTGAML